jgi:putative oxidoreductase
MGAFLHKYGPLGARLLVVGIFFYSGMQKFADVTHTAVYIASTFIQNGLVSADYAPLPIWRYLGITAGLVEWAGALMVLLGFRTRAGAGMLLLYLVPVTILFHVFGWAHAAEAAAANVQALALFKNLAIMAALLQLATYGPGRPSFDVRS